MGLALMSESARAFRWAILEEVIGAFIYLDITPKGRNEKEIMDWVRRHDEYGVERTVTACHSD